MHNRYKFYLNLSDLRQMLWQWQQQQQQRRRRHTAEHMKFNGFMANACVCLCGLSVKFECLFNISCEREMLDVCVRPIAHPIQASILFMSNA